MCNGMAVQLDAKGGGGCEFLGGTLPEAPFQEIAHSCKILKFRETWQDQKFQMH